MSWNLQHRTNSHTILLDNKFNSLISIHLRHKQICILCNLHWCVWIYFILTIGYHMTPLIPRGASSSSSISIATAAWIKRAIIWIQAILPGGDPGLYESQSGIFLNYIPNVVRHVRPS